MIIKYWGTEFWIETDEDFTCLTTEASLLIFYDKKVIGYFFYIVFLDDM